MQNGLQLGVLILTTLFCLSSHAALPREGSYALQSGTEGCPESVELVNECGGFTLTPMEEGQPGRTEKFCHINAGLKKEQSSVSEKILRKVKWDDGRIQKNESQIFMAKNESVELTKEDSIIPDQAQGFLWDHSHEQKGFSCLYKK